MEEAWEESPGNGITQLGSTLRHGKKGCRLFCLSLSHRRMALLHAVVARDTVVLAEQSASGQKLSLGPSIQAILSKITPGNNRLTYAWDGRHFHYITDAGAIVYLVVTDESAERKIAFAFLTDLQRKFRDAPSSSSATLSSTPTLALQGTFSPVIGSLLHTYNTAPPQDEIARAQAELNQVKDIMVQNVEQILSRGERIELLMDKTDSMAHQATAFRRGARTARRQMRWKNIKTIIISALVLIFLLYIIVAQFCGAALQCGASY